MTITTAFNIGDRVQCPDDKTFTVGQIRIDTLDMGHLILIQYRANYNTGRNGTWWAECFLRKAETALTSKTKGQL